MITLANPWWLLAVPIFVGAWLISSRRTTSTKSEESTLLHPQTALLMQLSQRTTKPETPWLWLTGCTLLIIALAQPQWHDETPQQGRNFMLALDISSSMKAQDFQDSENPGQLMSRLEMVKKVVDQFISHRQGDRIGLLIFADDAFTVAPMTTDLDLLRDHLFRITQGSAGQRTALGDAIALGVSRLQNHDERSRILVLLTDGTNTSGETHPLNALKLAQHYKVRIYPIGIGSNLQVMFPRSPAQKPAFEVIPMDEQLLQHLAEESGGRYYQASAANELAEIVDHIETLETVPLEMQHKESQEWFTLPLFAGLLLLLLSAWHNQQRRLPC